METKPFTVLVTELIKPMYLVFITAAALLFFSQAYLLYKENTDLKKRLGRDD